MKALLSSQCAVAMVQEDLKLEAGLQTSPYPRAQDLPESIFALLNHSLPSHKPTQPPPLLDSWKSCSTLILFKEILYFLNMFF